MFNTYAKYWLLGSLILTMLSGCDNVSEPKKVAQPEADKVTQENTSTDQAEQETALAPAAMPSKTSPAPEPKVQVENQPVATATESKPEVKPEPKATVKIETKPETKPNTKPEPKLAAPQTPPVTATAKAAGSEGITTKQTELRAEPQLDGKMLLSVPASTPLLIFERVGGWYKVNATNNQGWVKMLHVSRLAAPDKASAGSELASVAAIATGREGTDNVAATTGIRGLNEENLATAAPDMARLQTLDGYGASNVEAEKFALRNGLTTRTIVYLKEPKK